MIKLPNIKWAKWVTRAGRSRRIAALALAAVLCVTALGFTPAGKAVYAVMTKRDLPIYSVQKDSKVVSLTFDAAWGNEDTEQLIEIFDQYDIKVTFFIVGEWADKYPESVKALHDAGHEVMNHSNKHDHMPQLSAEQIAADIKACDDKIEAITGVRPFLFRPPYGDYDDKVVATLRSIGHYTIQWDVEALVT